MQIRCPHCHNPIDVVNDDPSGDISCPSCGSCFNLAKDADTARYIGSGRLLGNFQLLDRLGQGAFGEVWKARDTELARTVAIKIPRNAHLNEEDNEKFLREARAAAQVRHPNIVSVHEVGRENGFIYIASDFIDGASLDEWVQVHPLTVRESIELCAKIAEALHHAHEAGVVHRDLKPQNILVDTSGEPHVADFGLAKRDAGEITMTVEGAILGTPAYMPPEQARGEAHQADRRSDVYSLGVILFRLLTGELPFRGQRQILIVQILNDQPPALRKLDARLPRDVETICLKCLEKDPARRYQSAAALSDDLRRWLSGHPIEARPVSRAERAWRWCHRNPAVASLIVTVVLVLLTGMAVSSFFALQSAARNRDLLKQMTRTNEKADEVRRHLYLAQMNLAQRNWENAHVGLVLNHLEQTRPQPGETDLRGFEWHYWDQLCHSYLLELKGHTGGVSGVTFSPDGKRLASSSYDGTVKVWDAMSGQETLTLKGHTGPVMSVTYSADGKRVASAGGEDRKQGEVKIWDATSGQETLTLKGHARTVDGVAFSPDGMRLASASRDETVKAWDATSGLELFTLKLIRFGATSVAFSPDGERLASASGDLRVWDPITGHESLKLKGHVLEVRVRSVTFSPDGKWLASAGGEYLKPGEVKIWDATSGHEMLTLKGHTGDITSVAFSANGKRLASASEDQTVKVWDVTNGQETLTLKGHTSTVTSVVFSPDGKRLASASEDQTVKVWDATSIQETLTLKGHTDEVKSVAFSADGRWLVSAGGDETVEVWDATNGVETLFTLEGYFGDFSSAAFSADGKRLASNGSNHTVKVWDVTNGHETLVLKGHTSHVTRVAFSADGNRLASASRDKTVKVWDTTSGQEMLTLKGHTDAVKSVEFSADGKRLASASDDGTVKVWDTTNGQEMFTLKGQTSYVQSVVFSADAKRLATASWDGTVKVWDATNGREMLTLKGHTNYVTGVAFSADGKRLASASWDQTVKVWDATNGQEMLTLKGHTGRIESVAFSPDGKRLASGSQDRTVKVWGAPPWTPELRAEREALSLVHFLQAQGHPQSEWLAALSADQTLSEPVRQRALQFAREWK